MKASRPLTKQERTVVETYMSGPKITKQQAYLAGYKVRPGTKKTSVAAQTTQTFNKPIIKSALANYTELVEGAITKTISDWKDEESPRKREIAMQNAQYVHDKIHGRAKQSIDVQTTSISLSLDLTGNNTLPPETT